MARLGRGSEWEVAAGRGQGTGPRSSGTASRAGAARLGLLQQDRTELGSSGLPEQDPDCYVKERVSAPQAMGCVPFQPPERATDTIRPVLGED